MEETVIDVAEAVRGRRITARSVAERSLQRIAQSNSELLGFWRVDEDGALATAARVDQMIAEGSDPGPLAGVPFGIKDLEHCAGLPTSFGSRFYKDAEASKRDSVHVSRLRSAGAVPIGKTATSEFGMDTVTATKAWGVTRNPWNPSLTPGGSSGGSAAAVSAAMVPFATASDGGGSTRAPASFTGLVGHKPSHGRIPLETQSLFSVLGALTTTVADTARYLDVVSGPHLRDRMTLPRSEMSFERCIEVLEVAGLKAAWTPDYGYGVMDPEMVEIVEGAAERLIAAAALKRSSLDLKLDNIRSIWRGQNGARLWSRLALEGFLPDRLEELSDLPKRSIQGGHEMDIEGLFESERVLAKMNADVAEFFTQVDVLLSPVVACEAFAAEGPAPAVINGLDASATGAEPIGFVANACWLPAISVPAGMTRAGLPVGLMITARPHRDDLVLRLARLFELAQPWRLHAPGYPA